MPDLALRIRAGLETVDCTGLYAKLWIQGQDAGLNEGKAA
jgi:hypothetical protein